MQNENTTPAVDVLLQQAEEFFQQQSYGHALEVLLKAQALDETNAVILSKMTDAYSKMGKWQEAKETCTAAIRFGNHSAAIYVQYGEIHLALGEWKTAAEMFTKAIAKERQNERAYLGKARALMHLEDHEQALQIVERLLEIKPDCEEAHHAKIGILLSLTRLEEARQTLDELKKSLESFEPFAYDQIRVLMAERKAEEALPYFQKYFSDSNDAAVLLAKAKCMAFLPEYYAEAEKLLTILQTTSLLSQLQISTYLLLLEIRQCKYEEALMRCQQAIEQKPGSLFSFLCLYARAVILQKMEVEVLATSAYEEAAFRMMLETGKRHNLTPVYLLRVLCLAALKQTEKAQELLDDLLILFPNDAEVKLIHAYITEADEEELHRRKCAANGIIADIALEL